MTFLGSLGFTTPWFLAALASLPMLWYLLRISPPQPRRIPFPPLRILRALTQREETPARTPPWLLLLRLIVATLIIVALSGPVLNPEARLAGGGPVVLVVDDGWAAAPDWNTRVQALDSLIERAERSQRPVVLVGTAPGAGPPEPISLHSPAEARRLLRTLRPLPWNTDRAALARRIAKAGLPTGADVFWVSDGLQDGGAVALGEALRALGSVRVMVAPATALGLSRPPGDRRALTARVVRATAGLPQGVEVLAATRKGLVLGRAVAHFGAGDHAALATFDLPAEARNQVARLSLAQGGSAGGVVLLDETSAWRVVGLVAEGDLEQDQPLLSTAFYLDRALSPFADLTKGDLDSLLQRQLSVLVLADVGRVPQREADRIAAWVRDGGVLVRFAGPRLAKAQADGDASDPLLPVPLRQGDRALGGALSWEKPAHLAPFDPASPFAGLTIPPDVAVKRQVLAEPGPELSERTWGRLTDGTPLVTGMRQGDGWIVLFHVTANVDWSNLPMSGLFVEMLRRLVDLGHGVAGGTANPAATRTLMPHATLDGFGRLGTPPPEALPVNEATLATTPVGPVHPPGFYAAPGAEGGRALNLLPPDASLAALGALPAGLQRVGFAPPRETALARWLLAAAILLGVLDGLVVLGLRGQLPAPRRMRRGAGAALLAIGIAATATTWSSPAGAQDATPPPPLAAATNPGSQGQGRDQTPIATKSVDAALHTRLAYVRTGDPGVDAMSRAGLVGLSRVLRERTAFEPAEPFAVDPETDDLVFYPVIYWPMTAAQKPLSDAALAKVSAYMRHGGMILFDTRDRQASYGDAGGTVGEGTQVLRSLLSRLDVPPLVPVPENHVLTKSFYLLQNFPGRYTGGRVWVEAPAAGALYGGEASDRDGVSSIVIGSNDWAAAWATDDSGQPIADIGLDDMHQREMAYRFGVNLVIYALTGNYKADQVHVPALLERLGQ